MTNVECRLTNGGIASGLGLRSSSYDPTRRPDTSLSRFKMDRSTKDSRQAEYLKSKIRIPKSKIWFLKFLFFDQPGCPLAGGSARMKHLKELVRPSKSRLKTAPTI